MSSHSFDYPLKAIQMAPQVLVGKVGLSGSAITSNGIKGVTSIITGSSGAGSLIFNLDDTYNRLLFADFTYQTPLGTAVVNCQLSSSDVTVAKTVHVRLLSSGSSLVTPASGSALFAMFVMANTGQ